MENACQKIWADVLYQAIDEARGCSGYIIMEKARTWLRSDNQEIGSFLWICDFLNLDPKFVKRFLSV